MLIKGDNLESLKNLDDNSLDSVVTDPPYFLTNNNGSGFMGKEWDSLSLKNAFAESVLKQLNPVLIMGEVSTVQKSALTKKDPKNLILNVLFVQRDSIDQTARLSQRTLSVRQNVLTKAEVLVLSKGLCPNLTELLESQSENVLYVTNNIYTAKNPKSIAQELVLKLHTNQLCEALKTLHTLTEEVKTKNVTEARTGKSLENKFTKETITLAKNVEKNVLEERYNATTLFHTDLPKIITKVTSLPFVKDAMQLFMVNPSNIQILSERFHSKWLEEVFRVVKPGGHILAFAGTRTYHPLARACEMAGFEIRDQIMWLYGQGFPKSSNIYKMASKKGKICQCDVNSNSEEDSQQNTEHNLRSLQSPNISEAINPGNKSGKVLQSSLSEQSTQSTVLRTEPKESVKVREQPCVEGRSNLQENKGKLRGAEVCKMSERVSSDVEKRRLCNGTQISDGNVDRQGANSERGGSSQGPQNEKQQEIEFGALALQSKSQDVRSWLSQCSKCKKPYLKDGYGTALKPANEPIVLARKPLSEKTIVDNVLKWGVGCINIDDCRVEATSEKDLKEIRSERPSKTSNKNNYSLNHGGLEGLDRSDRSHVTGRFPANVILDDQAGEALDEQSGVLKSGAFKEGQQSKESENLAMSGKNYARTHKARAADSGGASRFFYVAKASKKERNAGLEGMVEKESTQRMNASLERHEAGREPTKRAEQSKNQNFHPTVKPVKLMEYLIKLVTPQGGTVLDPFMGSGSTGVAAKNLGFDFVGMELSEEYFEIAKKRIENA